MLLNKEQFEKIMDLADLKVDYENAVSDDITKALIMIERKLSSITTSDTVSIPAEFNILIVDDLELSSSSLINC